MKTLEFLTVASKLANTGLIRVAKKGEQCSSTLGNGCIGSTEAQNTKLWRKYRTLQNIVIFKTAEEANNILLANGITEFVAKNTKSKTMCRLYLA